MILLGADSNGTRLRTVQSGMEVEAMTLRKYSKLTADLGLLYHIISYVWQNNFDTVGSDIG